jgi:hypothetical protein
MVGSCDDKRWASPQIKKVSSSYLMLATRGGARKCAI